MLIDLAALSSIAILSLLVLSWRYASNKHYASHCRPQQALPGCGLWLVE